MYRNVLSYLLFVSLLTIMESWIKTDHTNAPKKKGRCTLSLSPSFSIRKETDTKIAKPIAPVIAVRLLDIEYNDLFCKNNT